MRKQTFEILFSLIATRRNSFFMIETSNKLSMQLNCIPG